jgi:hypothetical protein
METIYDFVILLAGGHAYVIPQTQEQCKILHANIERLCAEAPDRWICLEDEHRIARLHPKAIAGWYFQPHQKSTQEQVLELTKRMEKKMPDPGEGEDWKHGEG